MNNSDLVNNRNINMEWNGNIINNNEIITHIYCVRLFRYCLKEEHIDEYDTKAKDSICGI